MLGGPGVSSVSAPGFFLSLPLAAGFLAVASLANSPATLPAAVALRPSLECRDQTAPPPAAPLRDPHLRRPLPSAGRSLEGSRARQAETDALAVRMPDLLTQNHALRRENDELMDQVRRLLCEKANLLAQVRPPACPWLFLKRLKATPPCFPSF